MSTGPASNFKPLTPGQPQGIPDNGGMPLNAGVPYYSDDTKRQLTAVGWTEGDQLPPNFAEVLATLRDEVAADSSKAIADLQTTIPNYKPPVSKVVDITTLPQEKQAEIRNWLAGYKNDVAALNTPVEEQPAPQPAPAPKLDPQQVADDAAPQTGDTHTNCVRCHWPVAKPFNVEATEDDKRRFIIAILGGERFHKQYELLGGAVKLKLRSLTVPEVTMLNVQLGYMVQTGQIVGNLEYSHHGMLFRAALGTVEMQAGPHVLYSSKPIAEFVPENKPQDPTNLVAYLEEFTKSLKTETTVRLVSKAYREFQQLVELLEEMTDRPDFWSGIDLLG